MYDDYETFESWLHDFVDDGTSNWGVGVCWEYLEDGDCEFHCGGAHPVLKIGATSVTMNHAVPEWQRRLRFVGFTTAGSAGGSAPDGQQIMRFGKHRGLVLGQCLAGAGLVLGWC